jgi:hypothetical protein
MTELKRYHVKYIRDYMKNDYKAKDCCLICGAVENLELHHLYCVSELFSAWCDKNKIRSIDTVDEILRLRVTFVEDHKEQLHNDNLYTLCKKHHTQLHAIYGRSYSPNLSLKVKNWIEVQRNKHGR